MTAHAIEEMAEDDLDVFDIENVILNGEIIKKEKDDPRGIKYIINGRNVNRTISIGVVCRFKETGILIIITVYRI